MTTASGPLDSQHRPSGPTGGGQHEIEVLALGGEVHSLPPVVIGRLIVVQVQGGEPGSAATSAPSQSAAITLPVSWGIAVPR